MVSVSTQLRDNLVELRTRAAGYVEREKYPHTRLINGKTIEWLASNVVWLCNELLREADAPDPDEEEGPVDG